MKVEGRLLSNDLWIIKTDLDMVDVPPGHVPDIEQDVAWANLSRLF